VIVLVIVRVAPWVVVMVDVLAVEMDIEMVCVLVVL
jgi:hypothetical protein